MIKDAELLFTCVLATWKAHRSGQYLFKCCTGFKNCLIVLFLWFCGCSLCILLRKAASVGYLSVYHGRQMGGCPAGSVRTADSSGSWGMSPSPVLGVEITYK